MQHTIFKNSLISAMSVCKQTTCHCNFNAERTLHAELQRHRQRTLPLSSVTSFHSQLTAAEPGALKAPGMPDASLLALRKSLPNMPRAKCSLQVLPQELQQPRKPQCVDFDDLLQEEAMNAIFKLKCVMRGKQCQLEVIASEADGQSPEADPVSTIVAPSPSPALVG